jgi:UDP-galactopyranose mutase
MDQVVAQALTTYNQLTTKPVVQLAANVNGSASNLSSSNGVIESPAAASLEVAAVNGNGNGNGKSASK